MKKILILGVSAVQYDAIKMLNHMGYETHAIAMSSDGPGAQEALFFEPIDITNLEKVINYINRNNIDAVYSTGSDLAMPISCKISEQLNLPHLVSEKSAKICNNKDLMRKTLGSNFEGNIPFQVISSINDIIDLKYPLILKPTDSQGQRGVNILDSHDDFLKHYEETKKYSKSGLVIVEKYVNGPEISVNGYVVNGELKYLTASDRETWEQYVGLIHKHIVPSKVLSSSTYDLLWTIMNNLIKKIGIDNGPIYLQSKIEDGKPYIIEVTPRLDGCHMWNILNRYENINLMKLTFEHLLNNDTSELDNYKKSEEKYELEFICQKPNSAANYSNYQDLIKKSKDSYQYYKQNENIRPVNGKYEKIGYVINEI